MTATALFELDTDLDPRALFDRVVAAWRGELDGYEVCLQSTKDRGVQLSTLGERPERAGPDISVQSIQAMGFAIARELSATLGQKLQTTDPLAGVTSLDDIRARAQPPPPAPGEKAWTCECLWYFGAQDMGRLMSVARVLQAAATSGLRYYRSPDIFWDIRYGVAVEEMIVGIDRMPELPPSLSYSMVRYVLTR